MGSNSLLGTGRIYLHRKSASLSARFCASVACHCFLGAGAGGTCLSCNTVPFMQHTPNHKLPEVHERRVRRMSVQMYAWTLGNSMSMGFPHEIYKLTERA